MLQSALGGRAATVQVSPAKGKSLISDLQVDSPVVMSLTAGRALRLQFVTVKTDLTDLNYAKCMEVLTGPAADGPWTSVATFTSAMTTTRQRFAVAPDAPGLCGFVQVRVHDTYGAPGRVHFEEVSLEGQAWGSAT
jgi:hypothetical protein